MVRTRFTLDDLGGGLSERALLAFLRHLPPDSALKGEIDPDKFGWSRTDMLLARVCEGIEQLIWVEVAKSSKRQPKKPQPIERPGVKPKAKKIGRGAIPIEEFDKWYFGGD